MSTKKMNNLELVKQLMEMQKHKIIDVADYYVISLGFSGEIKLQGKFDSEKVQKLRGRIGEPEICDNGHVQFQHLSEEGYELEITLT
jgi:hypothetical protein